MATTMKGLLKGLRYITQIFDEEKEEEMQIGFPTDVKHVAHIGADGPTNNTPSWMNDFKPQEHENAQVVSRGNSNKYKPQANQRGAGLKELLPPVSKNEKPNKNEKPKKTRRKSGTGDSTGGSLHRRSSENGSSSDDQSKHSRHSRSKHGSMDSNDQEPSVRRRRSSTPVPSGEAPSPIPEGSAPPRKATSRPRKLKGSVGGEASLKKSLKGEGENSVDTCNDTI